MYCHINLKHTLYYNKTIYDCLYFFFFVIVFYVDFINDIMIKCIAFFLPKPTGTY